MLNEANADDAGPKETPKNVVPSLFEICLKSIILQDNWNSFVNYPLPREIGLKFLTELLARNKITDSSFQLLSPNLESIILEGCSRVSAQAIMGVVSDCVQTVNLSHCVFVTDDVVLSLIKNCPNIKSLLLNNCQGLTESSIESISVCCPDLHHLQLAKFPKKWPAFPFLLKLKQLKSLSLSEWNTLNDGNLESLGHLENLQCLDLTNCRRITERGMLKLVERNPLRFTNLILSGCLKVAKVRDFLSLCINMQSITFASTPHINDESLHVLVDHCTKLRFVTVSYCDNVTNEGITYLLEHGENLITASFLFLRQVTSDSVSALTHCKKLAKIRWEGDKVEFSDALVQTLTAGPSKLEEIYLQNFASVSDVILRNFLTSCQNLSVVYITNCPKFGDETLVGLGKHCPQLKTLIVDSITPTTDAGLVALSEGCEKLEIISIFNGNFPLEYTNRKITDVGVTALARTCPRLQSVSLRYFDITDECLVLFHSLTEITFKACKAITPKAVTELIARNQYLQVITLSEMPQFTPEVVGLWDTKNLLVCTH